jgi:hypothetical protein
MVGAIFVLCLADVSATQAQYLPAAPGPGPMPEPMPCAPSSSSKSNLVPGPITPLQAPKGPADCLGLSGDVVNAFDEEEADCCHCSNPWRVGSFWFSADYLLWWIREQSVPPLVTAGSPNDPIPAGLGQRRTVVISPQTFSSFSGGEFDSGQHYGAKFTGGIWLNKSETVGIDASFFYLVQKTASINGGPLGAIFPVQIGRPFFDINTFMGEADNVAIPGRSVGSFATSVSNRLWSSDANFLWNMGSCDCIRLDVMVGARYAELDEDLKVGTATVNTDFANPSTLNVSVTRLDQFTTRNRFYGALIGAHTEIRCCRLFANFTAKAAFGQAEESVNIVGSSFLFNPATAGTLPAMGAVGIPTAGNGTLAPGAIYAQPSNMGTFTQKKYAVACELNASVGYYVTSWMRFYVGYDLFHLNHVARPGDQIDPFVNGTVIPFRAFLTPSGVPRPTFVFRESDFWAQGINFGLDFRF